MNRLYGLLARSRCYEHIKFQLRQLFSLQDCKEVDSDVKSRRTSLIVICYSSSEYRDKQAKSVSMKSTVGPATEARTKF